MGYINMYRNSNYGSSHRTHHRRHHTSEPRATRKEVYYYQSTRKRHPRKPRQTESSELMRIRKDNSYRGSVKGREGGKNSRAYRYQEFRENSAHRARRASQILSGFN